MSKKKKKVSVQKKKQSPQKAVARQTSFFFQGKKIKYLLFAFACLLYANTLTHHHTQDDAIVITDNMYTQEGISGIPGLLTKDTFHGFFKVEGKDKLVSGGRYRPLTPIMFAVGYEMFGKNPFVGHLMNMLWYGLLGIMLYTLLWIVFCKKNDTLSGRILILAATLIFLAHPVHTEVVANIKGRDEIITLLGSLAAMYFLFKNHYTPHLKNIVLAGILFFLALMSKENAIMFLAIVPLAFLMFTNKNVVQSIFTTIPIFIAAGVFLIIRFSVLGMDLGGTPMELMNNPFIKIVNNQYVPFDAGEKLATILFTLGKYVQLLFFPHPLTNDYYPRQIEIMSFGNITVLLSLLLYLFLIVFAVLNIKKRKILSFGIFFYLITLFIVSNLVFPIGTNMSERFLFMPSVGFSIVIGWLIMKAYEKEKYRKVVLGVFGIVLLLFVTKTFVRNQVWKDDFTLFTTDVHTSFNSAKALNAAGGALSTAAASETDEGKKTKMLQEANTYLQKALTIHPNYKNAALLLGNSQYYLGQYEEAINSYDRALRIDPGYANARDNLAVALRDAGRQAGEKENDIQKAKRYLDRSLSINDNDGETLRLSGITYGLMGNHGKAIEYFTKVVALHPDNAGAYVNLGNAHMNYGDEEKGRSYLQKALELDPDILNKR